MLLSNAHFGTCSFTSLPSSSCARKSTIHAQAVPNKFPNRLGPATQLSKNLDPARTYLSIFPSLKFIGTRPRFPTCKDSDDARDSGLVGEEVRRTGEGGDRGYNWTTSVLLAAFWAGLIFYVFRLAPDQTPYRDVYFIQKLIFLKGNDGFQMNQVVVALWNAMALWPIIYAMLLLPAGRSSRSKVLVWPFLLLSFIGGAYALIPYFVLWKPPPPAIEEEEIRKWPLNILESRITAWVMLATGLGMLTYAGLANDAWTEFYQYFRESKLVHVMSLDFLLFSSLAPFWVYNDMTARKWLDKALFLLPLSIIPLLGPSLYVAFRPRLADLPTRNSQDAKEKD